MADLKLWEVGMTALDIECQSFVTRPTREVEDVLDVIDAALGCLTISGLKLSRELLRGLLEEAEVEDLGPLVTYLEPLVR